MADSDGEIEYLEEDEEIVQQCVRIAPTIAAEKPKPVALSYKAPQIPLLIERPTAQKRKKKEEEDSEYDPSDDNLPPSPPSPPTRKKRAVRPTKKFKKNEGSKNNVLYKVIKKEEDLSPKAQLLMRKKHNIRIPDFDDPLCLPVRAIKAEESDVKRLNNWNKVCMEHFKHCDTLLKPERGETKKSIRTAVFKNVVNKFTGHTDTTIWSKTCIVNEDQDKKSEIFQCVLPRYKEKKVLDNYILGIRKHWQSKVKLREEVVLCKETHKDGEALVVYKPNDSLSAVYGLIEKNKDTAEHEAASRQVESKMYLQELAACNMCVSCFQSSWRGVKKQKKKKSVVCPICARTSVNIYNLLSHFRTHSAVDVKRYNKIIAAILADIVGYHYKCRVCRQQFESIKALRQHIITHQRDPGEPMSSLGSPGGSGKATFVCEVCNRTINAN